MATKPEPTSGENRQLVISMFDSPEKARQAQQDITNWDEANEDIKLGASSIIYKDEHGKLQYDLSGLNLNKGMLVSWMTVSMMGEGQNLPFMGSIADMLASHFQGVTKQDMENARDQINQGKTALAVLCDENERLPLSERLMQAGASSVTGYPVPAQTITQVESAVSTATSQPGQVPPGPTAPNP